MKAEHVISSPPLQKEHKSSCVLACLYYVDGEPKKLGLTFFFSFFFFPFFLQSSLILALMLFKLALPEMSKGPHMVTVRSAPNLAGAWPAENNCALGWVRERRNLKDAQDTSGDDSNHLLWQSREIRQQLR